MFYILKFKTSSEVRHYRNNLNLLDMDCELNAINKGDYELLEALDEPVFGYDGKLYLFGQAPLKQLDSLKAEKIREIDDACSRAILAGFWYIYEGEKLHFSYDVFDQQNFADTANNSLALIIEGRVDVEVRWNAYTDIEHSNLLVLSLNPNQFLEIYQQGASFGHKAVLMEKAGVLKELVKTAQTAEEVEAVGW